MLHINGLTFRMGERLLFDEASVAIPPGHKVGLVGRNGSGKTTLFRMIQGELASDDGSVSAPKNASIGGVAQEAPGDDTSLLDTVLAADKERINLLAEAEIATDPERISDIQLRLVDINAHGAPSRAATILHGLGFDHAAQLRACSEFSGGWRMRVALAAALFAEPDILLLDEPTNYLDLEGTIWLELYLQRYPYTVVIISHDRELLNKCVTEIVHLDDTKLTLYQGGYDQFERTLRERQALQLKLKKKQDDVRRHMESFINRFRAQANKARQAQSRLKALARMKPIAAQIEGRVASFNFPTPERLLASPLIRVEHAQAGYEVGKPVLSNLNLRVDHDDRIGLLGANGNGKSTLAKLLMGKLRPLTGDVYKSKKLISGYFAQHQLDELQAQQTPYDHLREFMPDASEASVRARLGSYGFGINLQNSVAENLSGGEKARLLFAITGFFSPHLMIFDEPTNHLDVDSREALIHALNDYGGALILISHDQHLLEACVDRLWLVDKGTVKPFDGDLEDYRSLIISDSSVKKKRARPEDSLDGEAAPLPKIKDKAERRKERARLREQLAPLKKQVIKAENDVVKITGEIEALDLRLGDSSLYADDPKKAEDLSKSRGLLVKTKEQKEEDWLALSQNYEEAREKVAQI